MGLAPVNPPQGHAFGSSLPSPPTPEVLPPTPILIENSGKLMNAIAVVRLSLEEGLGKIYPQKPLES